MSTTQTTVVAYWTLSTNNQSQFESIYLPPEEEIAFTPDKRTKVPKSDYKKNGKYSGIVKLFMHYENQTNNSKVWMMGTGWMISSDVLVTAGHCVYNWAEGFGRVTSIRAYVGYAGADKSEQQFSAGQAVATTPGWLAGGKNKTKDVAFIKLAKAFNNVKTYNYASTPLIGSQDLFIVGYPADKTWSGVDSKGNSVTERGGEMYESKGKVTWNLAETDYMLSYKLSTAGGNSGSPVLLSDLTTSVATHVRGSSLVNSGTSIGPYGIPYLPYTAVINNPAKYLVFKTSNKGVIKYVDVPADSNPESVLKAISSVKDIGTKIIPGILQASFPFLGPVGGPLAALAGAVLGWVGSLSESNFGPEGDFTHEVSKANYAERAILAEAAVYTVGKMTLDDFGELDVLDTMSGYYKNLQPNFGNLSPKLFRVLLEHGTRIALDSMLIKDKIAKSSIDETSYVRVDISASGDKGENEAAIDNDTEAFMTELLTATYKCPGEESFIDDLGVVISQGLKLALPIMQTATSGLAALNNITNTEAAMQKLPADKYVIHLAKRAVLGEAILQGLMKADMKTLRAVTFPRDSLEDIQIPIDGDSDDKTEAAFFDVFKAVVQKIGRQVRTSAPMVIDAVTPVIIELLKGKPEEPGDKTETGQKQKQKALKFDDADSATADAIADVVENHIAGLMSLKRGSDHPHLKMSLEDVMREVENENGNLDGTRHIIMEDSF